MTLLASLILALGAQDAALPAPDQTARSVAFCLADGLPGGAQVHADRQGRYHVVRRGPRRIAAHWIVTPKADGVKVSLNPAPAGTARLERCAG